ncbi:unnamed protein product [Arctogadus glacialis]
MWGSTMEYFMFLLVPCVFGASKTRIILPGYETVNTRNTTRDRTKALTTSGKECAFPFRQGGIIHHQCITMRSSRPWCSLTHNFDRDFQWGFCAAVVSRPNVVLHSSRRRLLDPCQVNPCQNAGLCSLAPHKDSFECSCPESFSGRLCEQTKCYETGHLRFYDIGESWGRIHLRNVEQCSCVAGETRCERVRYTGCHSNPCENEGTCRQISDTGDQVCQCRPRFSGPLCSLEAETKCYSSRGRGYRGVVGVALSGARCLPWNSDLLHNELHLGTVEGARGKGLGAHNYCRNPDGDRRPWCYVLDAGGAISWEPCGVPACSSVAFHRMVLTNHRPGITQTISTRTPRTPSCGRRHKKRIARGRIIGGSSALPGAHPWMAAIYSGRTDFCGGTLIASCWVLTAAHCFLNNPLISTIRVVLGQQNFNVSGPDSRTFGVDRYVPHEKFSVFNPTLHDIMLVKLTKVNGVCVKKSQFIRPICLPEPDMRFQDGFCCSISGWGHMEEARTQYSSLQEGRVPLVPQDYCTRPEVYGDHVTSNMLCAGNGNCVDACQGDSGGPLACSQGDVSFLYGIISWGHGCRQGKPGVYTRVANYMEWINRVLKRKPRRRQVP